VVVTTGLGHQPRTGRAMPDVVRRLVERGLHRPGPAAACAVRGLVAEHDDHRISTAPSYRLHAVACISEG